GTKLRRNTPSVVTAAAEFVQFWDGRAETIEDATKAQLQDPNLMARADEKALVAAIQKDASYADPVKQAYPSDDPPLTLKSVVDAIAAYERTLMPQTRWDKFLGGDASAITDDEKKGFLKFVDVGCPTCHQGPLVGG